MRKPSEIFSITRKKSNITGKLKLWRIIAVFAFIAFGSQVVFAESEIKSSHTSDNENTTFLSQNYIDSLSVELPFSDTVYKTYLMGAYAQPF